MCRGEKSWRWLWEEQISGEGGLQRIKYYISEILGESVYLPRRDDPDYSLLSIQKHNKISE